MTPYECPICGERSAGTYNRGDGPRYTDCDHYHVSSEVRRGILVADPVDGGVS